MRQCTIVVSIIILLFTKASSLPSVHAEASSPAGSLTFRAIGGEAHNRMVVESGDSRELSNLWVNSFVPIRRSPPPPNRSAWGLDPTPLSRFFRSVDRIATPVPEWWKKSIVEADVFPDHERVSPLPRLASRDPEPIQIWIPENRTGRYVFKSPLDRVVVQNVEYTIEDLLPRALNEPQDTNVTGARIGARCVFNENPDLSCMAVFDDVGAPFKLTVLGPGFKTVRWQADVEGSGAGVVHGKCCHSVSIAISRRSITVFGADCFGAYLDCFSRDGTRRASFRTVYPARDAN